MKPTVVLAALFLAAVPAFASGPEGQPSPAPSETPAAREAGLWPQKGDTVYISADVFVISGLFVATGGPPTQIKVPACTPFLVKKVKVGPPPYWMVEPQKGLLGTLNGSPWSERLHRTATACKDFLEKNPAPERSSADGSNFIFDSGAQASNSVAGAQELKPGTPEPLPAPTDETWPKMGDTIYVAATLTSSRLDSIASTNVQLYTLGPCAPLTITHVKEKKALLGAKDDRGIGHAFKGDWSARIFRSERECRAILDSKGEPRVSSANIYYELLSP